MPATASDAPLNTTAKVRGRRLTTIRRRLSEGANTCAQLNSATPIERLRPNSSSRPSRLVA